jgi:hypothetical protein
VWTTIDEVKSSMARDGNDGVVEPDDNETETGDGKVGGTQTVEGEVRVTHVRLGQH